MSAGSEQRCTELDGLRGLAALSVFFFHVSCLFPTSATTAEFDRSPLRFLWDGGAAVDLFFVLSGFVLAAPFLGMAGRALEYRTFIVRRLFRILPAYWAALLLALLLRYGVYQPDGLAGLSKWVREIWDTPVKHIFDHVLLVGPWSDSLLIYPVRFSDETTNSIDPVIWTLVVELRISLVYPLIILLLRRTQSAYAGAYLLALSIALALLAPPLWALPQFVLGGLLARFRDEIAKAVARLGDVKALSLIVLAIYLYGVRYSFGLQPGWFQMHALASCGAALLIALVIGGRGRRLLRSRLVQFLGATSYSFYLFHLPLLIALVSWIRLAGGSIWLAVAATAAVSLVLAYASYRWIELPAQSLGRRLGLGRRPPIILPRVRDA
jgi:peptidoglycan/LPS O-acetylase OafA/YrhL